MKQAVSLGRPTPSMVGLSDVLLLYFLAALIFFVIATTQNQLFPGDLGFWARDYALLTHCVGGNTEACRQISKFPLGYTLDSFLLGLAPFRDIPYSSLLAALNSLALSLPILLLRSIQNTRFLLMAWGLYVVVWILTPIPRFYLLSGSLEVQAGALIAMAFVLTLRILGAESNRAKPGSGINMVNLLLTNGLWFMACLFKDTSVVTFSVAGLLLLIPSKPWLARLKGQFGKQKKASEAVKEHGNFFFSPYRLGALRLALPGFGAAAIAQASFNFFRYQNVMPMAYLNEAKITSTPLLFRLQSLFWSFLSPNGGMLVFWGLGFASLFFYGLWFKLHDRDVFLAIKAPILWTGITLLGISMWWNPFGWASWGNRLIIPSIMAVLICYWESLVRVGFTEVKTAGTALPVAHPSLPNESRRKHPCGIKRLIGGLLVIAVAVLFSAKYVRIGYVANPTLLLWLSPPELAYCTKMHSLLAETPLKLHLERVYGSNLWRQCALEGYRYNPVG